MLILDKIDFKTKAVKRDKEGHYIMITGSIQEEDITIINIYAPKTSPPAWSTGSLPGALGSASTSECVRWLHHRRG